MWIYKKLYAIALYIVNKVNKDENDDKYIKECLKDSDKLTYMNGGHAYLIYGLSDQWKNFGRYCVLDNAIQKLAKYEEINYIPELREILKGEKFIYTNDGCYRMDDVSTEYLAKKYGYEIGVNDTIDRILKVIDRLEEDPKK